MIVIQVTPTPISTPYLLLKRAFEKPVRASEEGYVAESENKLVEYAGKVYDNFAAKPLAAFCVGDKLADIAEKMTFPELLERLEAYLREQTAEA